MDRAETLIHQARSHSGLTDFGEDTFREGLGVLLTALDGEARLNSFGRESMDAQIVATLTQRLGIEDWYRRHPEIDEVDIGSPLVGLGLPRTGSTAFSCMLAEDPAVRSLRTWESISPLPPPETATEHSDPRIEQTRQAMVQLDQMSPRLKAMLPSSPTSPSECHPLMALDFKSHAFAANAQIPSYMNWLLHEADLVPTFRYVKRVLKLLQWRCPPGRWRLKNPSHILFIDAFNVVFPDARFWMTHRDVANVLPSCADLHYELMQPFSDVVDRVRVGQSNAAIWELGMQRLLAFRDAGNGHRFVDVHFREFQRAPIPSIERLYAFLGEELTADTQARMLAWREQSPRDAHGGHSYEAAEFGLDTAHIRDQFHFYHERFGVLEPQ